jgi:hypothetical protein
MTQRQVVGEKCLFGKLANQRRWRVWNSKTISSGSVRCKDYIGNYKEAYPLGGHQGSHKFCVVCLLTFRVLSSIVIDCLGFVNLKKSY